MESCSKKVYIRKSKNTSDKEKEAQNSEFWEVNSDELNGSFDSDEEEDKKLEAKQSKFSSEIIL